MQIGEIGKGIAEKRKQAGLSQEELAKRLGLTRQAISRWESGAALPTVDNLVELARVLEVSVDELLQLTREEKRAAEIEIKYEGYIKRQLREADRFTKLESKKLPKDADYAAIRGIRAETKQKLEKFRPENIGQASRISGVSPADIQVLMIYFGIV